MYPEFVKVGPGNFVGIGFLPSMRTTNGLAAPVAKHLQGPTKAGFLEYKNSQIKMNQMSQTNKPITPFKWRMSNRGLLNSSQPSILKLFTYEAQMISKTIKKLTVSSLNVIQSTRLQRASASVLMGICLAGTVMLSVAPAHAQRNAVQAYPDVLQSSAAGPQSGIDVLGDRFAQLPGVVASQTRLVLYRLQDGRAGATSIFVDKRYHDSLVPGAWTQLCYSAGKAELATRQMEAAARAAKDRYDAISVLTLQPGQVQYLRVDMSGPQPVLRPVASAQALQDLGSTREQLHTISRVSQECNDVEQAPTAVAAPMQSFTLAADTLFGFNRSDRAGMTDAGIRAIDMLVARLLSDYSRIDRINLVGHADPLGLAVRNEALALERAQTVRDYIMQTRQLQTQVLAEGRGSREPVVRQCGNTPTPQAIACNQPNRRVAVEVTGLRR